MNTYLIVKWLHVVSSVLMVGTGFGSAFYLFFVNRSRNRAAIAVVSRLVVRADWWFTTPAIIFQPLSGLWLAAQAGWSLQTGWLYGSLLLYGMAGACWLPVVWLQIRMAEMANPANPASTGDSQLPDDYWRYARYWERLGYPAFLAMLAVYFLMIVKPPI